MKQARFRFFAAVLLAAALTLGLVGCGSGVNSFTWFVDTIPANLDPQVAAEASDVIACENLYSGLVQRNSDGELEPELCESWSISSDGLTYTFYLKDGLTYTAAKGASTEYAITAEDFVFAFRRMFRAATNSPYAVEFSAIENSASVLSGAIPENALGITARDRLTLEFRLSEADENFLSKLTLPGAMPCDEDFFESTRSTYGLTMTSTLSSGHFYIYNWTTGGLFLRRASSGDLVDSLRLVRNTSAVGQSAAELIDGEKCTAAVDDTFAETELQAVSYSDTTWCLLFRCDSVFASKELRQALASAARSAAAEPGSDLFAAAEGLIPDELSVDGIDYRDAAGDPTPQIGDTQELYRTARQGIANSDFNKVTLLLPTGSGLTSAAEQINSEWQKQFSLFFSIEEVDEEEFEKRLAAGDYTIALAPIGAESGSVTNVLAQFTAAGGDLVHYGNAIYTARLAESRQQTGKARCALLAECERQLLEDCAVVPLFAQQKRLLIADGVDGLIFDPFGPVLDLTYTTKE